MCVCGGGGGRGVWWRGMREREREKERGRPGVCFPANYISVKSLHDTKISSFYVFGVSNGAVFFYFT